MFTSFIRIALRYLWRNKTYSILNFICLTFGLTCAIITALYITNIFSYDKFHKNYDRLHLVDAYVTFFNGDRFPKDYLSASLNDVLKTQVPEIEESTRIVWRDHTFINDKRTFTENGIYADANFFNLFTFPLAQGDTSNLLNDINSIVISGQMAENFFGSRDCLGKMLDLKEGNKQQTFKVTGILGKIPSHSVLKFDFIIPFSRFLADNKWASETGATANQTWVLLKKNVDAKLVDNKIKDLIKNQETTLTQELFLFPLKEMMLYNYAGGKRVWRGMQNVVIVGSVGFVILLIACFNFINLAMALNVRRFREVGIKKVAGSKRSTIVFQFLGETFILTLISFFMAIILVWSVLPFFNTMINEDIPMRFSDLKVMVFFIAVTLFTGLASGLFPALYLSSSNPVSVLKGKIVSSHSYSNFRQSLIVFQFTIPIVLIIVMMIIKIQDTYLHDYNPGVDKDSLIVLDNSANIQKHAESLKQELLSIPGIDAVSYTNCIPTRSTRVSDEVYWEGKDASQKLLFWCINSDFDYNKAVKIKMKDGRFFNASFPSDSINYVINDVAADVIKNKNPLGSSLTLEGKKGTIIGVFTDFHTVDLRGPYVPTIIRIYPKERETLLIKFSLGTYSAMTEKIGKVYKRYEPDTPFQPRLFSDLPGFSNLYTPSNLVGLAFIIAIALACLGLSGLASFTAESRTSIMRLLLTSYTKWLTIAIIIALPIAFLLGNIFMGGFYFHAPMPAWTFFAGPIIACFIALSTVSSLAWRAASRNPVEALRYE